MPNCYVDLTAFRNHFVGASTLDATDEGRILATVEAASRAIDSYANRVFYSTSGTRYFDGNGKRSLWLPTSADGDLFSLAGGGSIQVDTDLNGTWETTLLSPGDYVLWPDNTTPKNRIDIDVNSTKLSAWPMGRRTVKITGVWGYSYDVRATTITIADNPLSSGALTVTLSSSTGLASGMTVLVDSEQMFIESVPSGVTIRVIRGVNGTAAASHNLGATVSYFAYDSRVVEATMVQAGRLWKRRETAYANVIQNPATGMFEMTRGVDPDLAMLLSDLRVRRAG